MKIFKKVGLAVILILLLAQFFGPTKNEGDQDSLTAFINETDPPKQVHEVLKTTCYDCHSNITKYPWYNKITPVNYWMASHVNEGKEELNFSDWNSYSLKRKEHKMEEIYEEVEKKKMPLESYTWTHSGAKLTDEQIKEMVTWAKQQQTHYKSELNKQ